jgi:hypothetical protein
MVTGSINPSNSPIAYWVALSITAAVLLVALGRLVVRLSRGRPPIDDDGNIQRLSELTIVTVEGSDGPRTPVGETYRHQSAIEAARSLGGAQLVALLVPDATRWFGLRLRVGVQLVADERVYHAGFLEQPSDQRWNEILRPLRAERRLVSVPVAIAERAGSLTITLDLSGVDDAIRSASHQQPHS